MDGPKEGIAVKTDREEEADWTTKTHLTGGLDEWEVEARTGPPSLLFIRK